MNVTLRGIPYQSGVASDFYNIHAFYRSLTPDQTARLERREAIGAGDLTDLQRRLMITALFSSQYQAAINAWRDLEVQLTAMPKAALITNEYRDIRYLLYQYPLKNGQTRKIGLRQFQSGR